MRAHEFIIETASYAQRVTDIESGKLGSQAVNPLSGATGTYQMMPATFRALVKQAPPGSALSKATWAQHAQDPALQQAAFDALTAQNAAYLQKKNIEPTDANLYTVHRFGAGTAGKLLSNPDARLGDQLSAIVFKQNPDLDPNMTAGEWQSRLGKRMGSDADTKLALATPDSKTPTTAAKTDKSKKAANKQEPGAIDMSTVASGLSDIESGLSALRAFRV